MKSAKIAVIVIGIVILLATASLSISLYQDFKKYRATNPSINLTPDNQPKKQLTAMQLTSTVFLQNQTIPAQYTCDGSDISPTLKISGVPENAKSLALIVDDPDAPRGDFVHWTIWNIAPDTKEIAENSVPSDAIQGQTDFGRSGYGGPCPPSGIHRYQFKLYALDRMLNLHATAKKSELLNVMQEHILDETMLVGLYQRSI